MTVHQAPPSLGFSRQELGVGCHFLLQCMKVKSESEVAQSCPTLSDPMDCSPPGSSIDGIFQARVLEWGAIAFSNIYITVCEIENLLSGWSHSWSETFYFPLKEKIFLPPQVSLLSKTGSVQSSHSQRTEGVRRGWPESPPAEASGCYSLKKP